MVSQGRRQGGRVAAGRRQGGRGELTHLRGDSHGEYLLLHLRRALVAEREQILSDKLYDLQTYKSFLLELWVFLHISRDVCVFRQEFQGID